MFLRARSNVRVEYRVTEAEKETYDKLSRWLGECSIRPEHAPFQEKKNWLTGNENLILLIDPFSYTDATGNVRDRELNEGRIDQDTVRELLSKCWGKSACVILFWCAFPHAQGNEARREWQRFLTDLCLQHGAARRCFCYGIYMTYVAGIGKGSEIVDDIPPSNDWKKSCLKRIVKDPER